MRIIACSSYVCSSDLVTRRVVARQSVGVILTMSASFQVDEAGHDVQIAAMPEIPGHAELVDTSWSSMFDRRFVSPRGTEEGRGTAWLKMHDPIGDDPVLQACALADRTSGVSGKSVSESVELGGRRT